MKAGIAVTFPVLALAATLAVADVGIRKEQVEFKQGETSATLEGTIQGDQTVDYQLHVDAGEAMTVKFKPSNASAYFNVLPPGSEEAIFVGSTSGNEFTTNLKTGGEYTIRVYLMRNAARRNESAHYTLSIGVSGDVKKDSAPAAGATASNTGPSRWDASGNVKCSSGNDRLDEQCGFRVVRNLAGKSADIWIANTVNGRAGYRFLHYENQAFISNDESKLAWQRKDDNWWVSVDGTEFYFIPDALIHGG